MKIRNLNIDGLILIELETFSDARGCFCETFSEAKYVAQGIVQQFVQDNHSRSRRDTLRGLHYQLPHPQGKLIRVIRGEVFDVAVDLRYDSQTFGQWQGVWLNDENRVQFYIPPGFAHGFYVTSALADVIYKCTDYYHAECEHTIAWNDPQLAIDWPTLDPILGAKDQLGVSFERAVYFDTDCLKH